MSLFGADPHAPGTCAACDTLQQPGETREEWYARLRQQIADAEAVKPPPVRIERTTCKYGHLRATSEGVQPNGHRVCLACRRERAAQKRARIRQERIAS